MILRYFLGLVDLIFDNKIIIIWSYVIFDVWLASGEKENPAGLVVAVLAAEVQGGKAAPVLDVRVGFGLAQNLEAKESNYFKFCLYEALHLSWSFGEKYFHLCWWKRPYTESRNSTIAEHFFYFNFTLILLVLVSLRPSTVSISIRTILLTQYLAVGISEAGATFNNSFFDNSFVLVRQLKNRSFSGSVFLHVTGQTKN